MLMLSPKSTVKGLNAATMMRGVGDPAKGIGIHMLYNPSDRKESGDAEKLFRYVKLRDDPEKAREKNGRTG